MTHGYAPIRWSDDQRGARVMARPLGADPDRPIWGWGFHVQEVRDDVLLLLLVETQSLRSFSNDAFVFDGGTALGVDEHSLR